MAMRGKREYQFVDSNNQHNKITQDYFEARKMMYGAPRRAILMNLFKQGLEFYVNCHHCIQTNEDADIAYLLKRGKIELVNEVNGRKHKHSFVRLKR